jgi:hypothetical protein
MRKIGIKMNRYKIGEKMPERHYKIRVISMSKK